MEKKCFKCKKDKPLSGFYKHPGMKDGYLNKCKDCTKKDVHWNYLGKREQYSKYEKKRGQSPKRKAAAVGYLRKRRERNQEMAIALNAVSDALRDGRIEKSPCAVCDETYVQAHHEDYSKPLDVVWLCRKHHLAIHGKEAYEF